MSPKRYAIVLILLVAAGLVGGGLPPQAASAQQGQPPEVEPPPFHLTYDGLLDAPHLPSAATAQDAAAQDAAATPLSPEYASWSKLVFQSARNERDWEIYGAGGDGSSQVNLSNNASMDLHPRLNRGATSVVFVSNRKGNNEIYAMNADGSGQARLTNNDASDVYPAWSPDGSRIAFQSYRDGQAEIYVMNANGSSQTRLTKYSDYDGQPAWSPDGSRIAFVRRVDAKNRIWVMNADGSSARQLSNQPSSENPVWSPDGSQIAYDADGNGDSWQEIWLMDAAGGNQRWVYQPPDPNTDAWVRSWSPDGRYIAFTRISFVQQGGTWYWTTAYLEALDHRNPQFPTRLSNSGTDWNPDWQSTDIWAPTSNVLPLPAHSRAAGVEVRWAGSDAGPAGIVSYDVQYRPDPAGAWTPWLTGTSETSATFTGTGGQAIAFRVRARDAAGNLEAWQAADAADTSTMFYTWQLTGRLTDNRGVAIGSATVGIAPAPLHTVKTGADGKYLAYLTASGDHSLTVDRAGYGPLVVSPVAISQDRRLDYYLPPARNLITNGGFEAGTPLPTDWVLAGAEGTVAVSADAHQGLKSLLLGRTCPYPCVTDPNLLAMWANTYPDLASDSRGNVYLLWAGYDGGSSAALLAVRSPGGTWSAPENLGSLGAYDQQVGIAVDGHDVVHAVWPGSDGLYYRWRAPGAPWSIAQRLVPSGSTADIAADHLGGVHIIYYDWNPSGNENHVRYLERLPSGVWLPPAILDQSNGYRYPGVAVGSDASVHFIYQKIQYIDRPGGIFYRWRPYGGAILPEEQLWTGFGYSFWRQNLAVSSDNTVHAVFDWNDNYYSSRPAGGAWSTPLPLNTRGTTAIAADSAGALHVAGWLGSGPYSLYYRSRTPDGIWREPTTLGECNTDGPALTVDPMGTVHLANFLMSPAQGLYYWTSRTASDTYTVTASQRVTIPADMHRPTLAANYASSGGTAPLSIRVDTGISATEVFSATAKAAWQLAHADLTPWAGQQVTVTLMLHQMPGTAYTQIRVDDVTLGEWTTPVIASVDPPRAEAFTATPIVIHGMNFIATPIVRVGPVEAENVSWIDEQTLQATVPATLGPGIHDLWVTNPGDAATLLAGAFRSGKPTYLPLIRR